MFLYKLPDETPANRKMAKQIVERWSRPIFDSHRDPRYVVPVALQTVSINCNSWQPVQQLASADAHAVASVPWPRVLPRDNSPDVCLLYCSRNAAMLDRGRLFMWA